MPTFSTSPSSNDFVVYQTTVYYDSFKDLQNKESREVYEVTKEDDEFKELAEALSKVK